MRIVWVGAHLEGLPALESVLSQRIAIDAVFTLAPERARQRSGCADYHEVCRRFAVPVHEIDSINDGAAVALLQAISPDLVFVIGWMELVRPEVLRLAGMGMIGAHASLLPAGRGRAPINWALIHEAEVTGNTLFWLADGVDSGDIIDQTTFPISVYDTCATLYARVAESNRDMILRALPRLLAGVRPGRPQGPAVGSILRRRRPEDGQLDWSRPASEIHAMVRALTRPYPGAFTCLGSERLTVWQTALLPDTAVQRGAPGEVLGPVLSPLPDACGQVVACGRGAVMLLDVERDGAIRLHGRDLSALPWQGQQLGRHGHLSLTETA
jgi:methionyl-tRNA formyltransferase